jgi:hypothetical protein
MIYTIFSINDSRLHYKNAIRYQLSNWDEFHDLAVDGLNPDVLRLYRELHPYDVNYAPHRLERVGQLGVWYSVLNALRVAMHMPMVTFEDDAILHPNFVPEFHARVSELPEDTDFFALFLPRDQDHVYTEEMSVSQMLCKAYQRYGGVSMYYTPQGARKIFDLVYRDGLTDQYDDQLFKYVKAGELNGYTSKPHFDDLVKITGQETSIVQESEKIDAG